MKHAEYTFTVDPQHANARGELPMTTLLTWIIDAASTHAESRSFGYTRLRKGNSSWVLARIAVEMHRYPKAYDKVLLQTWVDGFNRFFSTRSFTLQDIPHSGGVEGAFGYAKSQWSVIDLSTRKACDLSQMSDIAEFIDDLPCPIQPPGKIQSATGDLVEQYAVRYSDIDVNRHMNTMKYIEHALNLFTLDFFDRYNLRRLESQFIAEVRFGDTLSFYRRALGDEVYTIEIRNQNDTPVNRLKLTFEEI